MENKKNIEILERFLKNEASVQEIHYLLSQLDHTERWNDWTKDKWEKAGNEIDTRVEQKMLGEIRKTVLRKPLTLVRFHKFWNIAASFLILALSVVTFYLLKERDESSNYDNMIVAVDKGQKASVTLPDGTHVWINSASRLQYGTHFNSQERRVELEGEAYFEVAKRPDCPFIVTAGDISVTALGTVFNVKCYPDDSSITTLLVDGSVEVESSSERMRLLPGQSINYDYEKRNMHKSNLDDLRLITGWRENRYILEDQTLQEVTNLLGRQYNVTFRFTDESLKDFQYSGTIENTSLQSILQMLSLTSPLSYELKDSVIILSENKQVSKYYNSIVK